MVMSGPIFQQQRWRPGVTEAAAGLRRLFHMTIGGKSANDPELRRRPWRRPAPTIRHSPLMGDHALEPETVRSMRRRRLVSGRGRREMHGQKILALARGRSAWPHFGEIHTKWARGAGPARWSHKGLNNRAENSHLSFRNASGPCRVIDLSEMCNGSSPRARSSAAPFQLPHAAEPHKQFATIGSRLPMLGKLRLASPENLRPLGFLRQKDYRDNTGVSTVCILLDISRRQGLGKFRTMRLF